MLDYSATNLLASIRDVTGAGPSLRDWDDTRILRLVNELVAEYTVPQIEEHRKDYFVTHADTSIVASQASYLLPPAASGGKLRAAQLVDSSGNPYGPLNEYSLEEAINFSSATFAGTTGVPSGYYFEGNQIVLWPTPSGTPVLKLRLYYFDRPSTLVLNSTCVQITALPGGSVVTVASGSIPSGYSNTTAVDLVQNKPGFDVLLASSISSQTATSITFGAAVPSTAAVGDWVCLNDTAPVVTGAIPEIVMGCLKRRAAIEILAEKGDQARVDRLRSLNAESEKRAQFFLRRRNEGNHPKVGRGSLYRFRRGGLGF